MIIKLIPNYEEKYSITESGDVLSHSKKYGFGFHKEKWLKSYLTSHGYKSIRLGRGNNNHHYIHFLVAISFLEKLNNKNFVNHKDGNKLNNHYSNLEWCTQYENNFHAWSNGLNKTKMLSFDDIFKIRELRMNGMKYKEIALMFDIARETASNVVNQKGRFGEIDVTGRQDETQAITG
jgi:phage anti-repressor protein